MDDHHHHHHHHPDFLVAREGTKKWTTHLIDSWMKEHVHDTHVDAWRWNDFDLTTQMTMKMA
jgi:hypothetical protein